MFVNYPELATCQLHSTPGTYKPQHVLPSRGVVIPLFCQYHKPMHKSSVYLDLSTYLSTYHWEVLANHSRSNGLMHDKSHDGNYLMERNVGLDVFQVIVELPDKVSICISLETFLQINTIHHKSVSRR